MWMDESAEVRQDYRADKTLLRPSKCSQRCKELRNPAFKVPHDPKVFWPLPHLIKEKVTQKFVVLNAEMLRFYSDDHSALLHISGGQETSHHSIAVSDVKVRKSKL